MSKIQAAIAFTVLFLVLAGFKVAKAGALSLIISAADEAPALPAAAASAASHKLHVTIKSPFPVSGFAAWTFPRSPRNQTHFSDASFRHPSSQNRLVLQVAPENPPMGAPSQLPGVVVHAHNESELAQAISAAVGPSTTVVFLPVFMTITRALPSIIGPLQLSSASGSAFIRCSVTGTAFTALTIHSGSLTMSGLTWAGCRGVLNVTGTSEITITRCEFLKNNNSLADAMDMVRGPQTSRDLSNFTEVFCKL